jgi:hypothetical protein
MAVDMEHREGIEPSNTGFADQRVSHFATGAQLASPSLFCLRGKIFPRKILLR